MGGVQGEWLGFVENVWPAVAVAAETGGEGQMRPHPQDANINTYQRRGRPGAGETITSLIRQQVVLWT